MNEDFEYGDYICTIFQPLPMDDPDWYEYRVSGAGLEKYSGVFDSLVETYNGVTLQRLNKQGAIAAAKDLVDELVAGGLE